MLWPFIPLSPRPLVWQHLNALRPLSSAPSPMLSENQSTAKDEGHQRCALESAYPLLESLGLRGDHGWVMEGVSDD
jgi:hypothetical protein